MNFFLCQRWRDVCFVYNFSGVFVFEFYWKVFEEVWVFDIYFVNEKNVYFYYVFVLNKMFYVFLDGKVLYSIR